MAMMINSPTFHALMQTLEYQFEVNSQKVKTTRWQGMDVSKKPDMATRELLNVSMSVSLPDIELLEYYRGDIQPNLPWADDHFEERVLGLPLNPGETWKSWPWALSADKFRTDEQFNHTYHERYWPKYAGRTLEGHLTTACGGFDLVKGIDRGLEPIRGIRHTYGDLTDLVHLIAIEPDTRQAYIPIFFPEDTGIGDGGRKPCTLGYQVIMRDKRLHIIYPIRSCDVIRHLRDDIYLTVRLLLWILQQCRQISPKVWRDVTLGTYTMHCTSLHMFENDWVSFIKRRTT